MKKKVHVTPKVKDKPKDARSLVWKCKEHIVCFLCNQQGHYWNYCPKGRYPNKDMRRSSNLGGAYQVKPKEPLINEISIYYDLHAQYHDHKFKENSRIHNTRTTHPKDRKLEKNLGKNPKKTRHIPRKRNVQGNNEKSIIEDLEI